MGKFSDQVNKWNEKNKKMYRAIAKTSVQDTMTLAQHPMRDGGRMRIKTGFLRASIQAALNAAPRGPTNNPKGEEYAVGQQVAGAPVAAVLLRWNPLSGEQIFIGWTANYARPREYKDGFLRSAVGKWDSTVRKAVKKAEARFG